MGELLELGVIIGLGLGKFGKYSLRFSWFLCGNLLSASIRLVNETAGVKKALVLDEPPFPSYLG